VANVCSTCHVFQVQLFEASPHKAAFAAAGMPACVTCHSNHAILHPTDDLIGTGEKAICTQCHTEGDSGYAAAAKMKESLRQLALAIGNSEDKLKQAERSGMEVGQAKLELVQARDALTKARVTIHTFNVEKVEADTKPGMAVAMKGYDAGVGALKERNVRRIGLGFSLVAIAIMVAGLTFYIKRIESSGRGVS
jgi:predicted CXXCH cytochrome family protein